MEGASQRTRWETNQWRKATLLTACRFSRTIQSWLMDCRQPMGQLSSRTILKPTMQFRGTIMICGNNNISNSCSLWVMLKGQSGEATPQRRTSNLCEGPATRQWTTQRLFTTSFTSSWRTAVLTRVTSAPNGRNSRVRTRTWSTSKVATTACKGIREWATKRRRTLSQI